jgi:hypothetical protein
MFGDDDDEELEEEQGSEVNLEDDESDEDFEDEDDEDDSEEVAAGFEHVKRRIDPDESDFTHAVDCPLDESCTCNDAE